MKTQGEKTMVKTDHMALLRAALRSEERKLKDLLDSIELNDVTVETALTQIRQVEDSLRRLRQAA
jgi:hypothetical protein